MLIARLIADQPDWETRLRTLSEALVAAGMELQSIGALPELGAVWELRLMGGTAAQLLDAIDAHIGPCDCLVSEAEIEVPRLFVSDMDSTMIGQECIDELADFAGLKEQISEITERAMQGELDFERALLERVGLLEGLEEGAIDRCLSERISPTPGARVLTQTLKAKGARTVLVTGGFHHFADEVADWLGFDRVVGNRLGVAQGKLTGRLDGPISDASTKLATLREEAAKLGEGARILGSGDGANDIPMLEAADYGFAYRAKPKAREMANGRVDRGDLTVILSLLGIPKEEWIGS
ncbi:phosphoserine phosphatase SerB [Qipengyuania sp. S6317L1]|uniref:phosphoserine phosphatase SerB n=1 Tax=Qipengyuania sp. S6317L1 TaxID=2926410 RepID=UPI001FF1FB11|nr:phosphoserine phosphatase SerB [Qipengyuania sp. S6317L1]